MAEIDIQEGFENQGHICMAVEEAVWDLRLNDRLEKIIIKHPSSGNPIDMNYLFPKQKYLELEIVDSLDNLEGRIRHELMHVADQMDRAFGYSKRQEPRTGTAELRRYKYLWNVYIDSRLIREGLPAYATTEARERELAECFPELSEQTRKELFHYLWNLNHLKQKELVIMSRDIFHFSKELQATARARGEELRHFETLEELQAYAEWGEIAEA